MNQFKWLLLILLLILSTGCSLGQDSGGDEAGGGETETSDSGAQGGSPGSPGGGPADPNLLSPANRQGYGKNVATSLGKTQTAPMTVTTQDLTIAEQTIEAFLQFGVLVGVALLVGMLFMLNVGLEILVDNISEKMTDMFGKKRVADVEDPAALVGTFKRYK